MAEWQKAAQVRNEFADMIESLNDEQLAAQTLCDAWNGKEVLAHLVSFAEISGFGLFGNMVKNRFNFEKVAQGMVDKRADRSTAELVASLRSNGTSSAPLPSFPEELTVSDVVVHTQDVRRPLGLGSAWSDEMIVATLDFITKHKHGKTLVDRPPLDSVKLVATDLDWTHGEGDEISGPAESLMMGLAARPVLDELSGDGLKHWQ